MSPDERIEAHQQSPVRAGAELERTAAELQAVERIAPGHVRHDRFQRRRLLDGGRPLREAEVRCAKHADLSVRKRLVGGPGNGVKAVTGLVLKWDEITRRCESPARILEDN